MIKPLGKLMLLRLYRNISFNLFFYFTIMGHKAIHYRYLRYVDVNCPFISNKSFDTSNINVITFQNSGPLHYIIPNMYAFGSLATHSTRSYLYYINI